MKRYDIISYGGYDECRDDELGDWVKHEDAEKLLALLRRWASGGVHGDDAEIMRDTQIALHGMPKE
ncbi:MAG: hypothetical protein GY851_03300 [bacterium]|nr:hypothetical protein [bacterium]